MTETSTCPTPRPGCRWRASPPASTRARRRSPPLSTVARSPWWTTAAPAIAHTFAPGAVSWDYRPGAGDPIAAAAHTDACEVFAVDDDLYYAQFHHDYHPNETVSLVLDLRSGHALAVISILGEKTREQVAVQHIFAVSRIEELPQAGEAPAPTTELIGRRVLWVYSSEHAYEHVYLSPHWYTWQCLAGPEQGLADTDENTVWRVRPGIYVFTWREKVIPCGSVTIADHRDQKSLRAHGVLFGEGEPGRAPRTSPSARTAGCSRTPCTPPSSTRRGRWSAERWPPI